MCDPVERRLTATGAVTVADLYRELADLRTDMQQVITNLKVIKATAPVQLADHEGRIRTLERFRFTLLGAAVVVSAIVSAAGTWIGLALAHH
jgi:hypothetical protein